MEDLKQLIVKQAHDAFERATTMHPDERLEVYLDNGSVKTSDRMKEDEEILYSPNKVLCYQVYGHNHLEEEIVSWIDMARVIPQATAETALPEPTAIETSIRDLVPELATSKKVPNDAISAYEVFANFPVTLLGEIEQQIIEYWWSGAEGENGKSLAKIQIEEALEELEG